MCQPEQVIPYAQAARPGFGIRLGTIVAVAALLQGLLDWTGTRGFLGMMDRFAAAGLQENTAAVVHVMVLGSRIMLLAGAAMLLARRRNGGLVVGAGSVIHSGLAMPLAMTIFFGPGRPPHFGNQTLLARASSIIACIALMVVTSLLLVLGNEIRRSMHEPDWTAVRRACAWSALLFGALQIMWFAVTAIGEVQGATAPLWTWTLARLAAGALLAIGGAGMLGRQRWAWAVLVAGALVWLIHVHVEHVLVNLRYNPLIVLVGSFSLRDLANALQAVPVALLWILLLYHPQFRGRWGAS